MRLYYHSKRPEKYWQEDCACICDWWALAMRGHNAAFPLSSHADFEQLVSFIKACTPEKLYIFTGFAEELRRLIRTQLGLEAKAVPSVSQRTLSDGYQRSRLEFPA